MKKFTVILSVLSVLITGILSVLIGITVWANRPRGIRIPIETTSV
ncbi:MAG: hypothetical protein Q4A45_07845 [Clostridia bacterium]|nr:hypothetical protein [Clostridia bacterium]